MSDTDTRTDGADHAANLNNAIEDLRHYNGNDDAYRLAHRSLNALAAQLAEAEARNHRLATALEREVNRNRRLQTLVPMTAAQIEEYHHLQPGDLDTSGEETS